MFSGRKGQNNHWNHCGGTNKGILILISLLWISGRPLTWIYHRKHFTVMNDYIATNLLLHQPVTFDSAAIYKCGWKLSQHHSVWTEAWGSGVCWTVCQMSLYRRTPVVFNALQPVFIALPLRVHVCVLELSRLCQRVFHSLLASVHTHTMKQNDIML